MTDKEIFRLDDLESHLFAQLKPVEPRMEFVDRLKQRLENPPSMVAEPPTWKTGFLILAIGLLGGLIFLVLIRKLVRWFGR